MSKGGSASGGALPAQGGAAAGGAVSKGGTNSGGANSAGASAGRAGAAGSSTHTGAWKIMPLGDSITATTCYPQLLWQNLKTAGHSNFTFVGSVYNNQGCGLTFPTASGFPTEGHSGELVVTDTNNGSVATWFKNNPPDVVVMHFGTNDVWGNGNASTANNIIAAYSTILTQLRAINPNAVLFVAQIIPLNPSSNNCSPTNPCNYEATLDALIPAWAASHTTATSPVIAVNLETIFNNGYYPNSTYTTDGAHPIKAGAQLMADTLSPVLIANLPGI